jgi:hypothetical protein
MGVSHCATAAVEGAIISAAVLCDAGSVWCKVLAGRDDILVDDVGAAARLSCRESDGGDGGAW